MTLSPPESTPAQAVDGGSTTPTSVIVVPEISEALVADLNDLVDELAGDSITYSASMLRRDLRLAVRSFCGFTVTLTVPGPAPSIALNILDTPLGPADVEDCLVVQLPNRPDGSTASVAVYAAEPHDLDDLREELAYAFDVRPTALVPAVAMPTSVQPGISGLEAFCDAHQAIGALIASGHTPQTARVELTRQAHVSPAGVVGAAQALLAQLAPGEVGAARPS